MTKFIGDAVGVRAGRGRLTGKDMKKNMAAYLETGQHPDIEMAKADADNVPMALPDKDISRSYVFLDISIGSKPAGRLVIELFDDLLPMACNHFRNRCMPGSSAGLTGASFHKLVPHYALFGGKSAAASEGMQLQPFRRLQAVQAGTVSISFSGDEVAISLARSMKLDLTHQVVGRIMLGTELVDTINDLRVLPDDTPAQRISITKSGATNHLGIAEELAAEALDANGKVMDAAAKLRLESAQARSAVMQALQEGLGQKRKADAAGTSGVTAGAGVATSSGRDGVSSSALAGKNAAGGTGSGGPGSRRNVKAKMLDSMLGDLSSSSSDDEESRSHDGRKGEEGDAS